jgi:hypothetical protein
MTRKSFSMLSTLALLVSVVGCAHPMIMAAGQGDTNGVLALAHYEHGLTGLYLKILFAYTRLVPAIGRMA